MRNFTESYPFQRASSLLSIAALVFAAALALGVIFLMLLRSSAQPVFQQQAGIPMQAMVAGAPTDSNIITVTGSADMLVPPDEITVDITYREYWRKSDSTRKKSIDEIEDAIVKAAASAGIGPKEISINAYSLWNHRWDYWHRWYDYDRNLTQKKLSIRLSSAAQLSKIIKELKAKSIRKEGILKISMSGTSHSKIQEYRRTVKERAMQAAQEKSSYLLASVNEKRGRLVRVRELTGPTSTTTRHGGYWGDWNSITSNIGNGISNASVSMPVSYANYGQDGSEEVGMKSIKLRYEIEASFQILR